jgi:hypothetical protein
MERSKYTDQQRELAVIHYLTTGSKIQTADAVGCSRRTLNRWMEEPWWQELTQRLRVKHEAEFLATCTKIIWDANEATIDRLEHGDFSSRLGDDGEWIRKGMSGKDCAIVMGIYFDKLKQYSEQITAETASIDGVTAKLEQIGKASIEASEARRAIEETEE